MNTLYVLKGGMKFKFLALTVVFLLGFGVGNTAWGQTCTATASGNWNDAIWDCGTPQSHYSIVIPTGFTVTLQSSVAWGGSQPVTINGTLDLNGYSFSNGTNIIVNGSVLGNGSLSTGYGAITVGAGGQINIGGDLVSGGNLTFGNNSSVAIGGNMNMTNGGAILSIGDNVILNIGGNAILKACTISATTEMRVKGSVTHSSGVLNIYGKLIVNSNFESTNGNGLNIYTGGELVIKGYANFEHIGTLALSGGNLLISGDLSYDNGNALVVNSPSFVAVGGDFDLSETMTVGAGAQLIVLGDLSADNQITINGDMSVVGQYDVPGWIVNACTECSGGVITDDCCNISSIIGDIPSSHPIWNVIEGINSIYFEGFDSETDGELVYDYSGETDRLIWSSDNIQARCNDHIKASAYIWLVGSGTIHFEYSLTDADVNSVTGWNAIGVENTTTGRYGLPSIAGTQIKLRIRATGLNTGSKVTMDNILVQATNEGGIPADPVVWIDQALIATTLCPPETVTYSIDNDNGGLPRYSSIVWKFTQGGGVITPDADDPATCTVDWETLPGELSVTVTGGSCGGETTELTSLIAIAKSPDIVLHSTVTPISCNGVNDGSITVVGDCGPDNGEPLVYTWESVPSGVTNPGGDTSASNLPPGDYTITVTKGSGQMDTKTITLTAPDVLAVTFTNLNNFLCAGHEGEGSFTVVPTGGTSPYTVAVDGTPYPDPVDWAFTNLSNGTYNIVVTDAHGCVAISEVVVQLDAENPTFTNFPANVQMDNATYNAGNAQDVSVLTIANQTFTGPQSDAVVFTSAEFSLARFYNARLTFSATQGGSSWTDAHYLRAEVSVDNGSSWTQIFNDVNTLNSATVTASLGASSDLKKQVLVHFTVNLAAGQSYSLNGIKVVADEQVHILPVSAGGGNLIGCADNSLYCSSPTYVDSDPIWNGSCKSYDNGEFRIERTWTTSDACRSVSRTQYLSVGTAPEFTGTFPGDETRDFCNNTPTIQSPMASDGCGDVTVSWEVRNSANEVVGNGVVTTMGENVTLPALPADPAGNTDLEYTVTWTATDEAHMTLSQDQKITIKPAIVAEYTYNVIPDGDGKLNVCLKQPVQITIAPKGGTGVYTYSDFSPAVTGTAPVVTTTGLTTTTPDLSFKITDVDNGVGVTGGCTVDLKSASFDVRDLIPTGGISRE